MNETRPFIKHFVLEFWTTKDADVLDDVFDRLIERLNLRVIKTSEHVFDNGGKTRVSILSASHIALHTWPELNYGHIDLLCCRPSINCEEVENVVDELVKNDLRIENHRVREIVSL